jgi:hypothetical protein
MKTVPSGPGTLSHPGIIDSNNYGCTLTDLSASKKSQSQHRIMNRWLMDSAFIVHWGTISGTNARYSQATMHKRFVSLPRASRLLKQTSSAPLPQTRGKTSLSRAHWLCWWTCPHVFVHLSSRNSLCICKFTI